jgi:hypothetical protein
MDVIWLELVYDFHPGCEVIGTAMAVTGIGLNDTVDLKSGFVVTQPTAKNERRHAIKTENHLCFTFAPSDVRA